MYRLDHLVSGEWTAYSHPARMGEVLAAFDWTHSPLPPGDEQ